MSTCSTRHTSGTLRRECSLPHCAGRHPVDRTPRHRWRVCGRRRAGAPTPPRLPFGGPMPPTPRRRPPRQEASRRGTPPPGGRRARRGRTCPLPPAAPRAPCVGRCPRSASRRPGCTRARPARWPAPAATPSRRARKPPAHLLRGPPRWTLFRSPRQRRCSWSHPGGRGCCRDYARRWSRPTRTRARPCPPRPSSGAAGRARCRALSRWRGRRAGSGRRRSRRGAPSAPIPAPARAQPRRTCARPPICDGRRAWLRAAVAAGAGAGRRVQA